MVVTNKIWKSLLILFLSTLLIINYASAATDVFEEYAEDSHFIASRGNLPDTIDQEWNNTIQDCWLNITSPSYYKFDESINSIGNGNEILTVYLGSAYEGQINDSRIDEIYSKIGSYCEENSGISDVPVVFLWDEDEEDLTYEYDPDAFENIKNDPDFVAARGIVPIFEDENEWSNWSDSVFEARQIDELDQYYTHNGGPILSYGFNRYSGYIRIGVDKTSPEKVTDSSINEIYQIVKDHFEEEGVSDIPVVFMWFEPPTEDSSGFSSIMLVMCILILTRFRK
ncbi:MAG: hypothetical protein PWQ51_610 [Methanolobus sp.]|jgi:hypothetical protein|uniref:hypothetical protein n=1 Tax=Methanolobus sp. TaxID=1874737 RepID=UPI0025861659|nr:hypothetical protein [Methanolobus sp.]MDK2831056.1 hypothetical protein [Methanolobus sp.]MDK2938446.1 hypothetical protein [Methanolobus sp.]